MFNNGKYDDKLRLEIIDEYLNGTSKYSLAKKYKLYSAQYITIWMKKLGIEDPRYNTNNNQSTSNDKLMKTEDRMTSLTIQKSKFYKSRIAELEKLLAEEKMKNQALTKVIDIAEKDLCLDIKKSIQASYSRNEERE